MTNNFAFINKKQTLILAFKRNHSAKLQNVHFEKAFYEKERFIYIFFRKFIYRGREKMRLRNSVITKYLWCLCITIVVSSSLYAQQAEKVEKRQRRGVKKNDLIIQDFIPTDTTSILKKPSITFPNINVIPYYYQPALLAQVKRYRMNKQWKPMFNVLYRYVNNFGIENFKDMSLIWQLARLSELLGKEDLTNDLYRLIIKHHRGDLQEALTYYDSLTQFDKDLYTDISYYYHMVERRRSVDTLIPPQDVLLNMGDLVNSDFDDYAVTVTGANDNVIYFSSKRNRTPSSETTFANPNTIQPYNEDLFLSQKDEIDEWSEATPIYSLNTSYNEGSPCQSPDGNILIFVRCNDPNGLGDCDLYVSRKLANGNWGLAQNLGPTINSPAWDSHPAFSLTGDTLYFSSLNKF